jgi:protein-disulfide isomerase
VSDARRGFAALALVVVGCGGSHAPPASPTGYEIDLTGTSASVDEPSVTPAPLSVPPAPPAVIEGTEIIDGVTVQRLSPATVPSLRPDTPVRGPANAPALIQIWSDFECPFCAQTVPLVTELERMFGDRIRIAWRAFPLPGHRHARKAATAALSVLRERGAEAFWKAHDALFATAEDGLEQRDLDAVVASSGADVESYHRALAERTFDRSIDADMAAGDAIPIDGTPSFLIGRYYVFGVAPLSVYAELIERTVRETAR